MKTKKIVRLTLIIALICMPSCGKQKDLTEYHSEGEKWTSLCDGVEYSFEYVERKDHGFYLKIIEDDANYSEERKLFNGIYVTHKYGNYLSVNGNKIDYYLTLNYAPFWISLGKVSDSNEAFFFLYVEDDDFNGYCKTKIHSYRYGEYNIHGIQIYTY